MIIINKYILIAIINSNIYIYIYIFMDIKCLYCMKIKQKNKLVVHVLKTSQDPLVLRFAMTASR